MTKDVLYHFSFSKDKDDLVALFNDVKICAGQRFEFPTELDDNLAKQLNGICSQLNLSSVIGRTMRCNDFYEGNLYKILLN
ncbi:hypothetical protein T12_5388 [Trichinella patagoniensis]|uniref:Uncharacterized protein n=1 Tax=Trichinella patagoniensis TaxID=990121 RepID=A0A0V1A762_9BILA|nr:hypothetical protein T12_5388 [Trichinella patagoniensis]